MNMLTGEDVRTAGTACHEFLAAFADQDWSASVPGLDHTVASVTAHAANGPLWYALDF